MNTDDKELIFTIQEALGNPRIENWQRCSSIDILVKKKRSPEEKRIANILDVGAAMFGGWRDLLDNKQNWLNNLDKHKLLNEIGADMLLELFSEIRKALTRHNLKYDLESTSMLARTLYDGEDTDNPELRNELDGLILRFGLDSREKVIGIVLDCIRRHVSSNFKNCRI